LRISDRAVVTALLWVKGISYGQAFDRHLWFSDTYVRSRDGWGYVFRQASLHTLPKADANTAQAHSSPQQLREISIAETLQYFRSR
jgi:hypothetical protein